MAGNRGSLTELLAYVRGQARRIGHEVSTRAADLLASRGPVEKDLARNRWARTRRYMQKWERWAEAIEAVLAADRAEAD